MRRSLAVTAMLLAHAGCGSDSVDPELERQLEESYREADEEDRRKAEANGNLQAVAYPECAQPIAGEKLSTCGVAVFEITLRECRRRVMVFAGSGSLLDEGAGYGWQYAAGSEAIASDEDRIASAKRSAIGELSQSYAVAVGNGTDTIMNYSCWLNPDFRIRELMKQGSVQKASF